MVQEGEVVWNGYKEKKFMALANIEGFLADASLRLSKCSISLNQDCCFPLSAVNDSKQTMGVLLDHAKNYKHVATDYWKYNRALVCSYFIQVT